MIIDPSCWKISLTCAWSLRVYLRHYCTAERLNSLSPSPCTVTNFCLWPACIYYRLRSNENRHNGGKNVQMPHSSKEYFLRPHFTLMLTASGWPGNSCLFWADSNDFRETVSQDGDWRQGRKFILHNKFQVTLGSRTYLLVCGNHRPAEFVPADRSEMLLACSESVFALTHHWRTDVRIVRVP